MHNWNVISHFGDCAQYCDCIPHVQPEHEKSCVISSQLQQPSSRKNACVSFPKSSTTINLQWCVAANSE